MNDILWDNYMNAVDEIAEARFQMDYSAMVRWAVIADTFAEML